jgi:hypothetical protein
MKLLKQHDEEEVVIEEEMNDTIEVEKDVGEKRRSTMNAFVIRTNKGTSVTKKLKQTTMNSLAKSRIPACRKIMRCIYVESLPLSLVKKSLFQGGN